MARFIQLFNDISNQVEQEIERKLYQGYNANFDYKLTTAINAWLRQAIPSQEKLTVTDYILQGISFYRVKEVASCIYEDWKPEKRQRFTFRGLEEYWEKSRLFNLVEQISPRLRIGNISMNFIVFLAFVITAVGYFIYILNKPKQPESTTHESDYRPTPSPEPSYRVSQPVSTPAPVQRITKKLLILVVSAAQESIIDSIKAKRKIDYDDCEKLYEATHYLCQDNESNLLLELGKVNQFQAIKTSEYDIYIITIELNQADEGFNKNVNQLDRYDAFRNLPNLVVDVQVSERLRMEAYGIYDVYSR